MNNFEKNNKLNTKSLIIIFITFLIIVVCCIVTSKNMKKENYEEKDIVNISGSEIEETVGPKNSLAENNEEVIENIKEEKYETTDDVNISRNIIEDKDIGYMVEYSFPREFELTGKSAGNFGSSHQHCLVEGDESESSFYATVSIYNKEEYIKGVIDVVYNNYKEMNYYNVNMKEEKIVAFEKEFECKIIDAQLNEIYENKEIFIYYNLDEENIFVVHLEGEKEKISVDLAEKFLDIDVKEIE